MTAISSMATAISSMATASAAGFFKAAGLCGWPHEFADAGEAKVVAVECLHDQPVSERLDLQDRTNDGRVVDNGFGLVAISKCRQAGPGHVGRIHQGEASDCLGSGVQCPVVRVRDAWRLPCCFEHAKDPPTQGYLCDGLANARRPDHMVEPCLSASHGHYRAGLQNAGRKLPTALCREGTAVCELPE